MLIYHTSKLAEMDKNIQIAHFSHTAAAKRNLAREVIRAKINWQKRPKYKVTKNEKKVHTQTKKKNFFWGRLVSLKSPDFNDKNQFLSDYLTTFLATSFSPKIIQHKLSCNWSKEEIFQRQSTVFWAGLAN